MSSLRRTIERREQRMLDAHVAEMQLVHFRLRHAEAEERRDQRAQSALLAVAGSLQAAGTHATPTPLRPKTITPRTRVIRARTLRRQAARQQKAQEQTS